MEQISEIIITILSITDIILGVILVLFGIVWLCILVYEIYSEFFKRKSITDLQNIVFMFNCFNQFKKLPHQKLRSFRKYLIKSNKIDFLIESFIYCSISFSGLQKSPYTYIETYELLQNEYHQYFKENRKNKIKALTK